MNMRNQTIIATTFCATVLAGCFHDDDTGTNAFARVNTPIAAQTATISIADPGGATPVVTVTQPADIELTATVTTPGVGGAGTIDVVVTATNNAKREITNFKAITVAADSTMGTATIASTGTVAGSGPLAGEDFMYFGKLVTAVGKTAAGIDDFSITLGLTPADPLVIGLSLPTEDVGLVTTDSYSGEEEIISIDTGVGGQRSVGDTGAYVFIDFADSSSYAANATEGPLSPDGRYVYAGHKTRPYILVLDTQAGTVDAIELLPPPETPYPSGQTSRIASVDSITMSPNGEYLYANILDGSHPYSATTSCAYGDADDVIIKNYIMKVEISTMEVMGQLDVTTPGTAVCNLGDNQGVLKKMSMNSAGTIGAAALFNTGRVVIVDLRDEMSLLKSVIVDNDPLDVDNKIEPHFTAVHPDGSKVYVVYNNNTGNEIDVIDTDDYSITQIVPTTVTNSEVRDLRFGPDGRLYFARSSGGQYLTIFDVDASPMTELEVLDADVGNTYTYGKIAFSPYGDYYYYNNSSSQLYKFDITTDVATADSPIASGSDGYHITTPTKY